jgi:uncharacterized protein YbjT (DUF2867 family)
VIAILGATGQVGGKIADILKQKSSEKVRLIARSADDLRRLVNRQAEAMAGDALDTQFLVKAFQGADAVFTLIPPQRKSDDFLSYADAVGKSIARAVEIVRLPFVVDLSSVGAELVAGTGPIVGLHNQEERLNRIAGLNVLHLRAGYFMENLLTSIALIKSSGINGSAIRGDVKIPMIAAQDIAEFAAERLAKRDFSGSSIGYLLGRRDISLNEATMTIGIKIGQPNLRYVAFSYADAERRLVNAGLSADVSRRYIEMSRAFNEGRISAPRSAESYTGTSFGEFCDTVFVPIYMRKVAA